MTDKGKRPSGPIGWMKPQETDTPSHEWAEKNLPPTPLAPHLVSLHLLTRYLLASAATPLPMSADARANALAAVEHHLREIAVFTRPDPFAPPSRRWG